MTGRALSRTARSAIAAACLLAALSGWGQAAVGARPEENGVPIDPLRQDGREAGDLSLSLAVRYRPRSSTGLEWTDEGDASAYVENLHDVILELQGSYALSPSLSVGVALHKEMRFMERARESGDAGTLFDGASEVEAPLGYAYTASYTLGSSDRLEPAFGLSLAPGRHLEVEGTAVLLRDPLVVTGALAYRREVGGPRGMLSLGAGVGFIANDFFTLGASLRHTHPVSVFASPLTSLGVRLGYALGEDGFDEIALSAHLTTAAGGVGVTFGIEWGRRG